MSHFACFLFVATLSLFCSRTLAQEYTTGPDAALGGGHHDRPALLIGGTIAPLRVHRGERRMWGPWTDDIARLQVGGGGFARVQIPITRRFAIDPVIAHSTWHHGVAGELDLNHHIDIGVVPRFRAWTHVSSTGQQEFYLGIPLGLTLSVLGDHTAFQRAVPRWSEGLHFGAVAGWSMSFGRLVVMSEVGYSGRFAHHNDNIVVRYQDVAYRYLVHDLVARLAVGFAI